MIPKSFWIRGRLKWRCLAAGLLLDYHGAEWGWVMGKISFSLLSAAILVAAGASGVAAFAQTAPQPVQQAPAINFSNLRLAQTNSVAPSNIIDFEKAQGPTSGAGIVLTDQYENSHGVTFGRGASIHFCARITDDVNASLCPYPTAAGGARAAAHDIRSGGPAMSLSFSRPVDAISMRINPTGGVVNEIFVVELNGFDANGTNVASDSIRFAWDQNAFTWPTSVTLNTEAASFARVTMVMRRVAQNNQAVRFLIDELALTYGAQTEDAPVLTALSAQRSAPPIADAEIVQSDDDVDMRDALRLYPAATRIRTAIDWDAVDVTLGRQSDLNLVAAAHNSAVFLDQAALPLLLPSRADDGSLSIVSVGDSYHADFEISGRGYSLYGTRVLSLINPAAGAPSPSGNVTAIASNHALVASFSLYGASYTLSRYCLNDSVIEDPQCHDREAIGDIARQMVVAVGETGRARP